MKLDTKMGLIEKRHPGLFVAQAGKETRIFDDFDLAAEWAKRKTGIGDCEVRSEHEWRAGEAWHVQPLGVWTKGGITND